MNSKLPLTEEIDFHYLLGLMPPLHNVPEFAWLPELFSIIGHEKLVKRFPMEIFTLIHSGGI